MATASFTTGQSPQFEQFVALRSYRPTLAWAPDGRQLAYSANTSGQFNLWLVNLDDPASLVGHRQLTSFEQQAVHAMAWSPDGQTLVLQVDQRGDERYQLYQVRARGSWPVQLTDARDAAHLLRPFTSSIPISPDPWSPDGTRLAYTLVAGANSSVVVHELASGQTHCYLSDGLFYFAGWSPDGQRMVACEFMGHSETALLLVETDGQVQRLTSLQAEAKYHPVGWSSDGRTMVVLSDYGREYVGLAAYDTHERSWRWIERPEWDIDEAVLANAGQRVAWLVNEDGYSRLCVRDLASGTPLALPELPRGVMSTLSFSSDGRRLAFVLERPTHPAELFVLDLEEGRLRQASESFFGGIEPDQLVAPQQIHFPSFDGRQIPALLYRPRQAATRVPMVLWVHGGPEAQERPIYSPRLQYLLSRGIGVLAPNIRGSTGYGKRYQRLIHRDFGGGDLLDIRAAVDYLHGLDWVDSERLGIGGGSYGGYMTALALGRYPELWAAGAALVAPLDWVAAASSVPPSWRRIAKKYTWDLEQDREVLIERSAITYVDNIRTPLLLIHGAQDIRGGREAHERFVARLRELGREVRYELYEDEGHAILQRANLQRAWRDIGLWFERQLLGQPSL